MRVGYALPVFFRNVEVVFRNAHGRSRNINSEFAGEEAEVHFDEAVASHKNVLIEFCVSRVRRIVLDVCAFEIDVEVVTMQTEVCRVGFVVVFDNVVAVFVVNRNLRAVCVVLRVEQLLRGSAVEQSVEAPVEVDADCVSAEVEVRSLQSEIREHEVEELGEVAVCDNHAQGLVCNVYGSDEGIDNLDDGGHGVLAVCGRHCGTGAFILIKKLIQQFVDEFFFGNDVFKAQTVELQIYAALAEVDADDLQAVVVHFDAGVDASKKRGHVEFCKINGFEKLFEFHVCDNLDA